MGAINNNQLKCELYILEAFNNTVDSSLWENSRL